MSTCSQPAITAAGSAKRAAEPNANDPRSLPSPMTSSLKRSREKSGASAPPAAAAAIAMAAIVGEATNSSGSATTSLMPPSASSTRP